MAIGLVKRLFGSRNERVLRRYQRVISQINELEAQMRELSDIALQGKTIEFQERFRAGMSLERLLPEAFAVVREASRRVLEMRHFDVQLIGGMVLHEGRIAEMGTGEGKTLVATLSAYLNALPGRGVHIVTVNDYLARRDASWMGPLYDFLGLSVGVVVQGLTPQEKAQAYQADIVYGTNNEFGFDYLRDNMALSLSDKVQRELNFAIVDEVDSILIDEARTPLIISGPSEESSQRYIQFNQLISKLQLAKNTESPGDFVLDEKTKQAHLTEQGHEKIEQLLVAEGILGEGDSLYASQNVSLIHYLNAALRAHHLFHRDVEYIVRDDQVVIVDEHTGRTMQGRRWSDGLHQALEAKEGVTILPENQTLAAITFQNYFRLYQKLAGMTGTADTEAYEFQQIYGLEVTVIPTNKPVCRQDWPDQIYLTKDDKFTEILKDIKEAVKRGQPVLVGTVSIETSEFISELLKKENIQHHVLNAKFHEQEAHIISEAGRPGMVTIATNMAGRGTDIVLGGNLNAELAARKVENEVHPDEIIKVRNDWTKRNAQVLSAGGLHIIGTERHESRRIDNQLRGRSGRQGDPGSSRFYLSLEDNLIRIFASDRVALIMRKLGMKENEPIEHPLVSRAIENAQRKVEGFNFDMRKQLLEYDNVANEQRKIIYRQRAELLQEEDISSTIVSFQHTVIETLVDRFMPPQGYEEQWDITGLRTLLAQDFDCDLPLTEWVEEPDFSTEQLKTRLQVIVADRYAEKAALIGNEGMRQFEKTIMLQTLDLLWREHLGAMDHLRQGIHLRGYAQKNPKQEYKREAFQLFAQLIDKLQYQVVSYLTSVVVHTQEAVAAAETERLHSAPQQLQYTHAAVQDVTQLLPAEVNENNESDTDPLSAPAMSRKVGRNDICPCGSGKKFKHCHGVLA
jgi:preprotein translocase subunit SecA